MSVRIESELFQLLIMTCCGLAMMMVFAARDRLMALCRGSVRLSAAVYLLAWVCNGFLFSQFLYKSAHGVLTVHGIVAMFAGILLWKKIICGIIFPQS